MPSISQFRVLAFDVYGTLIDWESGMIAGLGHLTRQRPELSRNDILEAHAFFESTTQRYHPQMLYSRVLAIVYKRLAEHWGRDYTWAECEAYGRSVPYWPAFADSAESMAYLRQHFTLVALTNCDNTSFSASHERLRRCFHHTFTAEDIGSYKPAPRNFDYMLEVLAHAGYAKSDILHVAESLFHDHVEATKAGLATCWIYRRHDQEGFGATMTPAHRPQTDLTLKSMAELVALHNQQAGAGS